MDLGKSGFGGKFAFRLIGWLKVRSCREGVGSLLFGSGGAMELPGVWDLGYFGWVKATDHTQNCEFFSTCHGRVISLLFGHSSIF